MTEDNRPKSGTDEESLKKAYARYASFYDNVFSIPSMPGIRAAVAEASNIGGDVLELGVGTGLALPLYKGDVRVTGIDLSAEMLKGAREKVEREGLSHVIALDEGDATKLPYADNSFDVVVMAFVITVVPDPDAVLAECERVLRPGGKVIIASHMRGQNPIRAFVEDIIEIFTKKMGWNSNFDKTIVTGRAGLKLDEERFLQPFGLVSLLKLTRV